MTTRTAAPLASSLLSNVSFAATLLLLCGLQHAVAQAEDAKPAAAQKVTFVDHVQPVLRQKCAACHNPDKKSGGLDLTNFTNLMLGGSSGEVIEPGDWGSYLFMLVSHEESPSMPPESDKLPQPQLDLIQKWIDGGALETISSKALASKKPKLNLTLSDAPNARPEKPAMPLRMTLDPIVHTERNGAVTAMATSPWAPLAAVASQKQVLLYDTRAGQLLGVLPFPEGTPQVLKFSRNGALLLAGGGHGGSSGKAIVWNVETGERVIEVGDELDTVLAADISADQSRIALGGPQKVVRIYSTATGELLHELRKHTDWIYNIEFSPDGVLVATADRNGGMFVWESYTGREYLTLKGHTAGVTGMSWRLDSNLLATGSEDATVRLWELENGREVRKWTGHGGGVSHLEFARDGRILTSGRDKTAKLWAQDGKQLVAFKAFPDIALRVTFCDETNHALAGDWSGEIRMWKADDGARVATIDINPAPIDQRLAAAQQLQQAAQAKHAPLAAAMAAADKAAVEATAANKAALAAVAAATAAATQTTQAAAAATKMHVDATAQHQAVAAQVGKLAKTTPALAESAAKAKAAAATAPEDKELAELAVRVEQLSAQRAATLAETQKVAAAKLAAITAAKQAMDQAVAAAAKAQETLKAAQTKAPAVEAAMKQAVAKAAEAKTAAAATAAEQAAAQQAAARWQDELQFAKQLQTLSEQIRAADARYLAAAEQADVQATQVKQMEAAAAAAKQQGDVAQKAKEQAAAELQAATAAAQAAQAVIASNTAQTATAGKQMAAQAAAQTPLKDAADKTREAFAKLPADAELKQALATLDALAGKKAAAIAETQKQLAALKAAAIDLATKKQAADKLLTDMQAKVAAAEADVAAKVAAMQAAAAKVPEATRVSQAAATALAKANEELSQLQQLLLAARNTPRPSAWAEASK